MKEPSVPNGRNPSTTGDPRQFRLIDLFALLTLAALASAIAAPLVRELTPTIRNKLLAVVTCQLLVVAATVVFAAYHRSKLLKQSGQRIGIGYLGAVKWRQWPLLKSVMAMLLLGAVQLALAAMLAWQPNGNLFSPEYLLFQLQLGYFTGIALSRYRWRVYPSDVEFFDHGISFGGTKFVGWNEAEVRRSQFTADRVVIVIRPQKGSVVGETRIAQVPSSFVERIMVARSARTGA